MSQQRYSPEFKDEAVRHGGAAPTGSVVPMPPPGRCTSWLRMSVD